jgi:excisionase family DNA binding protein
MPAHPPPQKMLSINQVADTLSVSTKTVRRMIENRHLHFHRVANTIRVSQEDLRAYINSARE